ncbi:MAG: hypothetical protein RBS80_32260, partial [Thermoguttaceae bacterium]|nr:hypothetical protein [Thermoguttaceae bacterium]
TTGDYQVRHSPLLGRLVPKGGKYGYDLIAHVGVQTFLEGRALQDIATELRLLNIPFSSLHDLMLKFLYYFGHLHRQYAAPLLRDGFQQHAKSVWLMDATVEPGTPAFFGVLDAESGLCLEAWKIPTESADDIAPCLHEATARFGRPHEVLHDLGDAMAAACEAVWGSAVAHRACHFHLLRDIGEDLYAEPQAALRALVRKLKLQPRLKEQRRGQSVWLRDHVEDPTSLAQLLIGRATKVPADVLGREVLVAVHQWILDYPSDGRRQGYPFDPYLLYLHRRVSRAAAALERLLDEPAVRHRVPQVLGNLWRMLQDYLNDKRVKKAADEFEHAWQLFTRLRTAMRLSSRGGSPLHDPYALEAEQNAAMQQALEALREEFRNQAENCAEPSYAVRYAIIVDHLDRYWSMLFPAASEERTTNRLESHWAKVKRYCRQRHGRKKLTLDFQCLPPEIMLIPNLQNPQCVERILGDLSHLPAKLALTGQSAPPWTYWRNRQKTRTVGRLPQRLLRQENLIDRLVAIYEEQCQPEDAEAA